MAQSLWYGITGCISFGWWKNRENANDFLYTERSALYFFLNKGRKKKNRKTKKNEESKKPRRKKYLFKISTTLFSTNRSGRVLIRSRITRKRFPLYSAQSLSLSLCLYQLHRSAKLVESFAALPLWHSSTGASNDPVWDLLFFSVRNSLNGENKDKSEQQQSKVSLFFLC